MGYNLRTKKGRKKEGEGEREKGRKKEIETVLSSLSYKWWYYYFKTTYILE